MPTNSFFSSTEDGQIVWLSHVVLKLPIDGPLCGIRAEEITGTLVDITYWLWMLQYWHLATQLDAKESTVHKQLRISGSVVHPQSSQFPNPPPAPGMQKHLFSHIVRINGGDGIFLAVDTVKPCFDECPLVSGNTHETREYRLRWWGLTSVNP